MQSEKNLASQIELSFWQDPTSELILVKEEKQIELYCQYWINDDGDIGEGFGKITFFNCLYHESIGIEQQPYRVNHPISKSFILQIDNSELLSRIELLRLNIHPNYRQWDKLFYKHFVIQGASCYVQILSTHFTSEVVGHIRKIGLL